MAPVTRFYPAPIPPPSGQYQAVDKSGFLTQGAVNLLQQMWVRLNGANLIVPCVAVGTNVITLTPMIQVQQGTQGTVAQYFDYATFAFIAAATSTGLVTGSVAGLSTIKVVKTNGSVQAGAGDLTINLQYFVTFVDTLDSGNGAFVLR